MFVGQVYTKPMKGWGVLERKDYLCDMKISVMRKSYSLKEYCRARGFRIRRINSCLFQPFRWLPFEAEAVCVVLENDLSEHFLLCFQPARCYVFERTRPDIDFYSIFFGGDLKVRGDRWISYHPSSNEVNTIKPMGIPNPIRYGFLVDGKKPTSRLIPLNADNVAFKGKNFFGEPVVSIEGVNIKTKRLPVY